MSAASLVPLLSPQLMLRSWRRRELPIEIPRKTRWGKRRRSELSGVELVGHIALTTVTFQAMILSAWVVSLTLSYVHSVHPLPDAVARLLLDMEVGLVYVDAVATGTLLLVGLCRYILHVLRGDL